tara:strand:+ start:197 stop:421 length:225 start_codon:yes stop_codon:yes gene_type:complete
MDESKFNRILKGLREEMMSTDPSSTGKAGFSSKADDEGPVAGYDKKLGGKVRRRKKYAYLKHDKPRTRWKNATK